MALFMPRPQDRVPLRDGEAAELLDFARQHIPRMHRQIMRARRNQPAERFAHRFEKEIVPLLRHLQRVHTADPELGALQIRHAELRVKLLRRGRAMRQQNRELPPRLEREMRKRFAEMIEIEKQVITKQLAVLAEHESAVIDRRTDELLDKNYDPVVEPPALREAVFGYRMADDEVARIKKRAELRKRVEKEIKRHRTALQHHLKRMNDNPGRAVDERMKRLRSGRGGPGGPRRPGRG